jgi:hypothetical protein
VDIVGASSADFLVYGMKVSLVCITAAMIRFAKMHES